MSHSVEGKRRRGATTRRGGVLAALLVGSGLVSSGLSLGCAPSTSARAPATAPATAPGAVAVPSPRASDGGEDAFAVSGTLTREDLPGAMPRVPRQERPPPTDPPGVPPAPPSCRAYVARTATATPDCGSEAAAHEALADALEVGDAAGRDAVLVALERCAPLPPGLARALRIELAPVACADALATPFLTAPPPGTEGLLHDAIHGLALAGKLSRTTAAAPAAPLSHDKEHLERWTRETLKPWIEEQATAIETLSRGGAALRYYGRAVVAVEAGMAEMRFIDVARNVPIPDEFKADEELAETYRQALEDALEPRKRRGRDAALVGLGSLATIGLLRDPRVDRARELLSRMYGGAPIDALDALLLPPLEPRAPAAAEERLAARLQSFYASLVLAPDQAQPLLRFLMERGLALPHRIALASPSSSLSGEERRLLARTRLEMAQSYWRRVDVDEAVNALHSLPAAQRGERGQLILATALALRGGPKSAAAMMTRPPTERLGVGDVTALDALAAGSGPYRGMAAFNAAYIGQLTAPADAAAEAWDGIAARYTRAAALLEDIRYRKLAEARRDEAQQIAAAIRRRP